jgi:hypothetical protein
MREIVEPFMPTTFGGGAGSGLDDLFGPPQPLFSREDFPSVLQARADDMLTEIRRYRADELLNTGAERLLSYFYDKYAIDLPVLYEENSSIRHYEEFFELKGNPSKQPDALLGTSYQITVPFTGDARIFNSRPSENISHPPTARIRTEALIFSYDQINHDSTALAISYKQDIAKVKQYLDRLAEEVDGFNSQIYPQSSAEIQTRRTKLLDDQGVAASLGIHLERTDLPATYAAPQIQRKPRVTRPKASTNLYVAEPELEIAEYEHILEVIEATSLVIERNPTTFAVSTEPQIRDHFLVQLNGHYRGQATGETFNSCGKSDILIRSGDKNIFIAEVKFWDGANSITAALMQLLTRYTTWRDSKIALIVLNRRRDFSAVLSQVPSAIETCENVIRRLELPSTTNFRYFLRHPDDPDKQLLLTVMCFEVPRRDKPH